MEAAGVADNGNGCSPLINGTSHEAEPDISFMGFVTHPGFSLVQGMSHGVFEAMTTEELVTRLRDHGVPADTRDNNLIRLDVPGHRPMTVSFGRALRCYKHCMTVLGA